MSDTCAAPARDDEAIVTGQAAAAVAGVASRAPPRWSISRAGRPIVRVAEAARRIGRDPGLRPRAEAARGRRTGWRCSGAPRRLGWPACWRRRGFGVLGDRNMVEQCIRIAEGLATRAATRAGARTNVRSVAADLLRRYFEAPMAREARSPA